MMIAVLFSPGSIKTLMCIFASASCFSRLFCSGGSWATRDSELPLATSYNTKKAGRALKRLLHSRRGASVKSLSCSRVFHALGEESCLAAVGFEVWSSLGAGTKWIGRAKPKPWEAQWHPSPLLTLAVVQVHTLTSDVSWWWCTMKAGSYSAQHISQLSLQRPVWQIDR